MIINDDKLLDVLYMENDDLIDFDELDLNNQHVLQELSKVKNIRINFRQKDNPLPTLKQLEDLGFFVK